MRGGGRYADGPHLVIRQREHVGAGDPGAQAVEEVGGVSRGQDHLRPLAGQGAHTRAGAEYLAAGTREARVLRIRAPSHVSPEQMTHAGKSGEGCDVITWKLYFTTLYILFSYLHSHPVVVQIP